MSVSELRQAVTLSTLRSHILDAFSGCLMLWGLPTEAPTSRVKDPSANWVSHLMGILSPLQNLVLVMGSLV